MVFAGGDNHSYVLPYITSLMNPKSLIAPGQIVTTTHPNVGGVVAPTNRGSFHVL